jgi:hypothetical protein
MESADLEHLIQSISAKDLKDEARKRGIALGRCPTKMDIAKKLPRDVLEKMAR